MKRILATLLFLSVLTGLAEAQAFIPFNQVGPTRVIRAASWSQNGTAFTFAPQVGSKAACFTITNNNSNTHNFAFTVWESNDTATPASLPTVAGTNTRFSVAWSGSGSVPSGGSVTIAVSDQGAANVAALVTSGTTFTPPDTFDIAETDSQTQCANYSSLLGANGNVPQTCGQTFQGNAATGTQIVISNFVTAASFFGAPTLLPRWHICSIAVTGAAATTSAKVDVQTGDTATTCAAATTATNSWAYTVPVGVPNYVQQGNPEVFSLQVGAGLALCFKDGGTTTGTTISINYDLY